MSTTKKLKVLLADDVILMRDLLRSMLRPYGLTDIEESSNGEDAMDKYKLNRHDLVMLDINMPIKSGIEALKEIKAINPGTFVVIVSGESTTGNLKTALACGVDGFIVKPYSTAKIDGIIQKFNQRRQQSGLDAIPLKSS